MIGNRYGKLTVVALGSRSPSGLIRWDCVCDCGNRSTVLQKNLRRGATRSCGCGIGNRLPKKKKVDTEKVRPTDGINWKPSSI